MGCRNGEAETAVELPASDSGNALLLATVSTVGLLVEVQVKDGSLYSGVFHTASVDEGYGIVLKKAMMIEKGKCNSALEVGALVDTLVVLSNDLVQVIVKDFLLPMEGDICYSVGDRSCLEIDTIDSSGTDATSRILHFIVCRVENLSGRNLRPTKYMLRGCFCSFRS
ncbi:hypothetical protein KSP40_PGU014097 [Platanthera guangdongensis]|uniref:Ataxin 2 SM domain-containing protein n=1 Tax=Platanthera guangdongensis TaxID=2320717 RepID=A0ABR2MUR5_9ASPA